MFCTLNILQFMVSASSIKNEINNTKILNNTQQENLALYQIQELLKIILSQTKLSSILDKEDIIPDGPNYIINKYFFQQLDILFRSINIKITKVSIRKNLNNMPFISMEYQNRYTNGIIQINNGVIIGPYSNNDFMQKKCGKFSTIVSNILNIQGQGDDIKLFQKQMSDLQIIQNIILNHLQNKINIDLSQLTNIINDYIVFGPVSSVINDTSQKNIQINGPYTNIKIKHNYFEIKNKYVEQTYNNPIHFQNIYTTIYGNNNYNSQPISTTSNNKIISKQNVVGVTIGAGVGAGLNQLSIDY